MRRILTAVGIGLCALSTLTACGDSENEQTSSKLWDESDVVEHMDLKRNSSGISWTFRTNDGTRCNIAVVLTSASAVDLYSSAGDTVATNPDKTAGVKIVDRNTRTCFEAATEALEDLD